MKLIRFEDLAGIAWYLLVGETGEAIAKLTACEYEALQPAEVL